MTPMAASWWRAAAPWAAWRRCGWKNRQSPWNRRADFRAILDALPIPVWLRDKGLALTWGNHAFLKGAGAADLEAARRDQVALDKSERDLAASAAQPER